MPAVRGWNSTGKSFSNDSWLYSTQHSAEKTAGYLGLEDVHQLRDLYRSKACKHIIEPYLEKQKSSTGDRKFMNPGPSDFVRRMKNAQKNGYGLDDPDTAAWTDEDWVCHVAMRVLNAEQSFEPQPKFGPFKSEKDLERWNRAYQLLLCAAYHDTEPRKGRVFNEDASENKLGLRPPFMGAVSLSKLTYIVKVINIEDIQQVTPVALPFSDQVQFRADPRIYDKPYAQDWLRREMKLGSLGLNIDSLVLVTQDAREHRWPQIQDMCKKDDKATVFEVRLRKMRPKEDIYEKFVPPQLLGVYEEDAAGNVLMRNSKRTNPDVDPNTEGTADDLGDKSTVKKKLRKLS